MRKIPNLFLSAVFTLAGLVPGTLKAQNTTDKDHTNAVNKSLVQDAVDHFRDISPLAETDYSRELNSLITAYGVEPNDTPSINKVYLLDPDKVLAGIALGIDFQTTVLNLLPPGTETRTNAGQLAFDDRYLEQTITSLSTHIDITSPRIITRDGDSKRNKEDIALFLPKSRTDYDLTDIPPGLRSNITNIHEIFHVLTARKKTELPLYSQSHTNYLTNMRYLIGFPSGICVAFANQNKGEARSDIATAGESIRNGEGTVALDALINYRLRNNLDCTPGAGISHMTVPALEGFKKELNKIGIEALQTMSKAQALAFYQSVTDQYGPTGVSIEAAARYVNADKARRRIIQSEGRNSPEVAKGILFARYLLNDTSLLPEGRVNPMPDLSESQKTTIEASLKNYNPLKVLMDRAFKDGGKIKPSTMIAANAALQDEAFDKADKMQWLSGRLFYIEKAARLQQSLIDNLTQLDYLGENMLRGIDIRQTEPCLRPYIDGSTPAQHREPIKTALARDVFTPSTPSPESDARLQHSLPVFEIFFTKTRINL